MKRTYKVLIIVQALIIAFVLGHISGSYEIYMAADVQENGHTSIMYPHFYNKSKTLKEEREYANALLEGLHRFYSSDDNDFWFDSFMHTKEYAKIDSLNGGDWEDFYYYETPQLEDWFSVYGTVEEPCERFKENAFVARAISCTKDFDY